MLCRRGGRGATAVREFAEFIASPRARPNPQITSHQVIQMDNLSHTPGKNLHLAGVFSGQRRKTPVGGK